MSKPYFDRFTLAVSLALLVLTPALTADEAPGDLWQSTSQMEMEGMPMKMPPQTLELCTAREWTHPPAGGDDSCVAADFVLDGPRATWTVNCSGQMQMSGVGEMVFTDNDTYTGTIEFTGDEMNMTVALNGHRIGTCDNPQ